MLTVLACTTRALAATIGILGVVTDKTYFGYLTLHHTGSAINIANDRLIQDGVLNNETLRSVYNCIDLCM